jgi:hypothetical protein
MEQLLQISQEVSEVKRDVAVLDVEVQNFKRVMEKLDEAILSMSRVSSNLERLLIVHEERIKTNETNLASHKLTQDLNLAAHKVSIDDTFVSVKARLLKLEDHKELMNKWRWQLVGAWSVIALISAALTKAMHVW